MEYLLEAIIAELVKHNAHMGVMNGHLSTFNEKMAVLNSQMDTVNGHLNTVNGHLARHNTTLIEIRDLIDRCCICERIDMCDITEKVLTRSGLM
jgi:hypothetical protein